MKLIDFLDAQGIPYHHIGLYKEAFTHPSYVNEASGKRSHYERLEFMGDAVLQLSSLNFYLKLSQPVPKGY